MVGKGCKDHLISLSCNGVSTDQVLGVFHIDLELRMLFLSLGCKLGLSKEHCRRTGATTLPSTVLVVWGPVDSNMQSGWRIAALRVKRGIWILLATTRRAKELTCEDKQLDILVSPGFWSGLPVRESPWASPERSVPSHRHTGHSSILCGSEHSPPLSDAVEPQIRNEHMLWNKKAATLC